MDRYIITIAREYGSGGSQVGSQLARELGVPFYDKESIVSLTAIKSGFTEDAVKNVEEKKPSSFLYNLYMTTTELPIPDQVFLAQSQVIREAADQGSCVIVGRCGDYVLRNDKDMLSVFIHASVEDRVSRIQNDYGVKADDPVVLLKRIDRQRGSYYRHFTQRNWGHAKNYHLCVDSGLGIDTTVKIIREALEGRNRINE